MWFQKMNTNGRTNIIYIWIIIILIIIKILKFGLDIDIISIQNNFIKFILRNYDIIMLILIKNLAKIFKFFLLKSNYIL
jgi:hypothetical protein